MRVWRDSGDCDVLEAHKPAVWAVAGLFEVDGSRRILSCEISSIGKSSFYYLLHSFSLTSSVFLSHTILYRIPLFSLSLSLSPSPSFLNVGFTCTFNLSLIYLQSFSLLHPSIFLSLSLSYVQNFSLIFSLSFFSPSFPLSSSLSFSLSLVSLVSFFSLTFNRL